MTVIELKKIMSKFTFINNMHYLCIKYKIYIKQTTMRRTRPFIFICLAAILACCSKSSDEEQLESAVSDFATAYFNYDLHKASTLCTQESKKHILFTASNIHENDIEILRSQEKGASVSIRNIVVSKDKTTGTAEIEVSDFMELDTIGRPGHITDKATFVLSFRKHGDSWLAELNNRNLTPYR